ncbi:hypothetical protein [Chryseobacterium lathyri]|uniref:hypothetical protein n=1 Tax=Chryseobacterium lathyri TaxID=395933 RepID=UPI00277DACB3|nr:hypothetical protein [Chryseobacterium lathyri]MDQ0067369.1 hypothetical protein [Chryseobacterium lathyri]
MGKDGVTIVSMAMGAGFFKKGADGLKDGIEDTGEKFIKKEADDIIEKTIPSKLPDPNALPKGTYSSLYEWESEKANENLIDYANVFHHWANDRMMSMIFEFEKDNGLVPTRHDNDGDLEYLSSWDSGVFTFHINEKNELEYKIVLTKNGFERVLEMPLKDYFIEGILEHYQITNTELSDEWKPWNTLIIKSPHNSIPYDKVDEFVNYTKK